MMLVDQERRVRKVNAAAAAFAETSSDRMIGLRGGEALRCANSLDDPEGCGFGPACKRCPVRLTVLDTFETGESHQQVEASLRFPVKGVEQQLFFLLSTTKLNVRHQPMVLVSILDITGRKQAEEAVKQSEQRFRSIFDNDHVAMLIIDPETGRIEDGSPGACSLYDYSIDELKKKTISEINILPPEQVFAKMQMSKAQKESYFDFQHRLGSGEIRDVEVCSGPIEVGGRILLFSVVNDVTERKKAQAALQENQERFRAVFESAEESMFIKDLSLKYTHVNPAMCRLLGLPAEKIVGRTCKDIYGEDLAKQLVEQEMRALTGESIEVEQTRPVQGTFLTFHDTFVPLKKPSGEIVGICCISRNVTERKKLNPGTKIEHLRYLSTIMRATLERALIAAKTDSIILLQGESGTGKDYLAQWLHEHSNRASGPFFSINCAALPRELAESELFGHERGAFTGASGLKKGLLELAEAGTILLNEIGELETPLQAKLLSFLDTRTFMRVGGQKQLRVNARLITATHRDIENRGCGRTVPEAPFLSPQRFPLTSASAA